MTQDIQCLALGMREGSSYLLRPLCLEHEEAGVESETVGGVHLVRGLEGGTEDLGSHQGGRGPFWRFPSMWEGWRLWELSLGLV